MKEVLSRAPFVYAKRLLRHAVMRWAVLLGSSLVAACIAASGFMLLTGLVVTRSLSPAIASYERELFFDYTQPQAVAAATFAPMPSSPLKVCCCVPPDRLLIA